MYVNRISERCTVSRTKIWQHSEGILSDPRVSVLYLLYNLVCRMIGFGKKTQRRGVAYSMAVYEMYTPSKESYLYVK